MIGFGTEENLVIVKAGKKEGVEAEAAVQVGVEVVVVAGTEVAAAAEAEATRNGETGADQCIDAKVEVETEMGITVHLNNAMTTMLTVLHPTIADTQGANHRHHEYQEVMARARMLRTSCDTCRIKNL